MSRAEDLAAEDALDLAVLVRDYGEDTITRFVDAKDRGRLHNMCVALACMVDIDRTPDELLGWLRPHVPAEGWKHCPRCERDLPLELGFYRDCTRTDGHSGYCKRCMSERRHDERQQRVAS